MDEIKKYNKRILISSIILILLSSLVIYLGITCIRLIGGLLVLLITNGISSMSPSTILYYLILVSILLNTCLALFIVNIIFYIKYIKYQKETIQNYKKEGVK